jgi:L-alanine-DL-glutamate epimerase-like enolase superfamily enzyme
VKLELDRRTLRLSRPFPTAYGELVERELLLIALTDRDGLTGYGEAAPLEPYDGVSVERAHDALVRYGPTLERSAGLNGAQTIEACRQVEDLPQALAAVDLALWDLAGKRARKPVAVLLCGNPAPNVRVNATIAALDCVDAAEHAAAAAREGFPCVKVKVGSSDDAARVAAVRAATGPGIALRLDANGAWGVDEAVATIQALSPLGLELVEEPTHGLDALRQVRERVSARIAIDESASEPSALGAGAADAVCLKISRCGGIGGLLAAAALVRAGGAEPYLASTLDGPLGIAAAVHAAAALASRGPVPPCGLATLELFEGDLADELPVRTGAIALPSAPGLGVGR